MRCFYVLAVLIIFKSDIMGINGVVNLAAVECGVRDALAARIVGGREASEKEFPWTVSVWRQRAHQCGGSIVTSSWIITAGHCVCNIATGDILFARQLTVRYGGNDLASGQLQERVDKIMPHPDYSCSRTANDIALLRTQEPLRWTDRIRPVCLPPLAAPAYSGSEASVVGWGWTREDRGEGTRPNLLNTVQVKVVENSVCSLWYQAEGKKINVSTTQMCAGYKEGGRDSCWADSGGPLTVEEAGRAVLVGVVSTGHGCARPRLPGIYTRVSSFVSWLSESVAEDLRYLR